ncbi:hypothetical protein [Devosia alba]|uniref:hypothetical protein n=1 Tax=Devosia alba TaxID=3152360 RepID=UPI0032650C88
MRWILWIVGVIAVLLGLLWLVQGPIPPILCVADCETLTGPDLGWAIAGLVLMLAGVAAVVWGRPPPSLPLKGEESH